MIGKLKSRWGRPAAIFLASIGITTALIWGFVVPRPDQLFKAIESGSYEKVRDLLSSGANPNAKDANGMTALNLACKIGRSEIIGALLAAGADANTTTDDLTPFGWAAMSGKVEALVALASAPTRIPIDGATEPALCYVREPEVAKALVKMGASGTLISKRLGMTGLQSAIVNGRYKTATAIMDADPRMNPDSLRFSTLPHLLCRAMPTTLSEEQWQEVEAFVQASVGKGMSFTMPDSSGKSPLEYLKNAEQTSRIASMLGNASVAERTRPDVPIQPVGARLSSSIEAD